MLCFHICTNVYLYLISNMKVVRTFENKIPIQMFKKWYNVSCRYVSYIKSEASNVWRTGVWFLKPVGEVMRKTISTT